MPKFSVSIPVESTIFLSGVEAKDREEAWEKALGIARKHYARMAWEPIDEACAEDWVDGSNPNAHQTLP